MINFARIMITELSILIPSYNSICTEMVKQLHAQCLSIAQPFRFEILVADDASTNPEVIKANQVIEQLEHCTFLQKPTNTGSASTRNFLAQHAQYEWLLFLDSDMTIPDARFVERYLDHTSHDVVNGGISIGKGKKNNLRYLYEHNAERHHTAELRNKDGFKEFRSTNFLIKRTLILQCPFDERFKHSGYEDVLLGKTLSLKGASILLRKTTNICRSANAICAPYINSAMSCKAIHDCSTLPIVYLTVSSAIGIATSTCGSVACLRAITPRFPSLICIVWDIFYRIVKIE